MWFRRCFRTLQLEQATNNLKRFVKNVFWLLFILLVDFMYFFKQAEFKNHAQESFLAIILLEQWPVISVNLNVEPCSKIKTERRVV